MLYVMMPRVGGPAAGDAAGEAGAGDGPGDAGGEDGVGDAPGFGDAGDADGEGTAGDAPDVGVAGDANGEGPAGDAMVDGAAGDPLTLMVLQGVLPLTVPTSRVLQVMVLGVGPRMGGCQWFWARALGTPGRGPRWRCCLVFSPVLAVLVASGVMAADGAAGAGDGVVDADAEGALQVLYRPMPRARAL